MNKRAHHPDNTAPTLMCFACGDFKPHTYIEPREITAAADPVTLIAVEQIFECKTSGHHRRFGYHWPNGQISNPTRGEDAA